MQRVSIFDRNVMKNVWILIPNQSIHHFQMSTENIPEGTVTRANTAILRIDSLRQMKVVAEKLFQEKKRTGGKGVSEPTTMILFSRLGALRLVTNDHSVSTNDTFPLGRIQSLKWSRAWWRK